MKYFYFLFISILLLACETDNSPDVSNIEVDFEIIRFDDIVMKIDTNNIKVSLQNINTKYPSIAPLYFDKIMPFVSDTSSRKTNTLNYINDSTSQAIYGLTDKAYGNLNTIKSEFTKAFKYYKYYFPAVNIPDVYTFISSFTYQAFLFPIDENKDGIAIGLDMFLNDIIPYKSYFPKEPIFSDYIAKTYTRDYIVQKSMQLLIEDKMPNKRPQSVIEEMINKGKIWYILDHLLPAKSDTIITNYSLKQLNWCDNNEYELWAFYRNNDLLYNKNPKTIAQYTGPAPGSPGLDVNAPGRTGAYIGWKIVSSYMKNTKEISFDDLLNKTTTDKILKLSKYKPRRKK